MLVTLVFITANLSISVNGDLTEANVIVIDEGQSPFLRDNYVFYLKDVDSSPESDYKIYYYEVGSEKTVDTGIHGRIYDFDYPYLVTSQSGNISYYNVETDELKIGPYFNNLVMGSTIENGIITFVSLIDMNNHFFNNETLNNQSYKGAITILDTETGDLEYIGWGRSPRLSGDIVCWDLTGIINYYNLTTKIGYWHEMETELYPYPQFSEFYPLKNKYLYNPAWNEIREYDSESDTDKLLFSNSSIKVYNSEKALIYNYSTGSYYLYDSSDSSISECYYPAGGTSRDSSRLVDNCLITHTIGPAIGLNPVFSPEIIINDLINNMNHTIANGSGPSTDGDYIAFTTNEGDVDSDFNEDGDKSDNIIRLVSMDELEVLKSPFIPLWEKTVIISIVAVIFSIASIVYWRHRKSKTKADD